MIIIDHKYIEPFRRERLVSEIDRMTHLLILLENSHKNCQFPKYFKNQFEHYKIMQEQKFKAEKELSALNTFKVEKLEWDIFFKEKMLKMKNISKQSVNMLTDGILEDKNELKQLAPNYHLI